VLFGGRSAEHDVSCVSARHVLEAARQDHYQLESVGITRDGTWVSANTRSERLSATGEPVEMLPALTGTGPRTTPETDRPPTTVVMPVLHGPMGEDGTIQGLLELADVAYVGAGVLASALCMDKVACKDHLAAHGVPQGRYRWLTVDAGGARRPDGSVTTVAAEADAAIDALGLPLFVKPANMGSSVGVSRATTAAQTTAAIELAASYDREVIIEEEIVGREIEIAVLGNDDPVASVAGEVVPGADFYDYADKYDDGADLLIPAPLSDDELAQMQNVAIAAYRACKVEGLARVDFFYEPRRGWLVNEINTMPGFTPISMYPKMWAASGLAYPDLIDRLVELGLQRHARKVRHTRTDH